MVNNGPSSESIFELAPPEGADEMLRPEASRKHEREQASQPVTRVVAIHELPPICKLGKQVVQNIDVQWFR